MGDELDAVALGLKRGRRGAVTVVVLAVLALVGFLVSPTPAADPAPPPMTPTQDDLASAPPLAVNKRSRGAPRTKPMVRDEKGAAPSRGPSTLDVTATGEAVALPGAGAPPASLTAAPAVEIIAPARSEAVTAAPVVDVIAPARSESVPPPAAASDVAVTAPPSSPERVGEAAGSPERAVVPAVDLAGPPPAPPAEDEDARDGNGEAIARAIAAAKRAAVRECFERELKQAPKLAGTVVVELDLAPPNTVRDVRVSDDLERPAFTRCVVDTMRDVRFSALDEEVSVRVPYALTPARK